MALELDKLFIIINAFEKKSDFDLKLKLKLQKCVEICKLTYE